MGKFLEDCEVWRQLKLSPFLLACPWSSVAWSVAVTPMANAPQQPQCDNSSYSRMSFLSSSGLQHFELYLPQCLPQWGLTQPPNLTALLLPMLTVYNRVFSWWLSWVHHTFLIGYFSHELNMPVGTNHQPVSIGFPLILSLYFYTCPCSFI